VTQTAPLAIYAALDSDTEAALALSVCLVVVSFTVLVGVKLTTRRWIPRS
jgi:ABC-type sulfate transport system permease component